MFTSVHSHIHSHTMNTLAPCRCWLGHMITALHMNSTSPHHRSTFRLGPGVSMDSLALTVARQCGVHEDVLRRAGELRNVLMQEHEGEG